MKYLAKYIISIFIVSIFAGCFLVRAGKEEKLIAAAKKNDTAALRDLLAKGADVNAKDKRGRTALMYAALNGNAEMVKEILTAACDVNLKDDEGSTPLKAVAYSGKIEIVRDFLEHGADVNSKDNDYMTVLMYASWNGHADVVRELLSRGADVNAKSKNGITALMLAVDRNNTDVMELLKQVGAGSSPQGKAPESMEAAVMAQGLTVQEFNDICMFYYTNPRLDKVLSVLSVFLSLEELISDREKFGSMSHFFSALAHKDKTFYEKVFLLSKDHSGLQKQVLETILRDADAFSSPQPDSQDNLNYLWSEFFATGDAEPIKKMIDVLGYDNPDYDNPGAPVTARGRLIYAAQWSLGSNAQHHKLVRFILEEESAKAAEPIKSKLRDVLSSGSIRK